MHDFDYHRPATLDEACALVAANADAKLIAGGMTLLPTMKMRLAAPAELVDLGMLDELRGIAEAGNGIETGAMTTHADIANSDLLAQHIPALAGLARRIGDPQVRNRGTIGGSLANSDPAADYPAAVLGLGATIVTDRREIAADDYFLGLFETALAPDEIVTRVRFPRPVRAAYAKYPNPASRYAIVGVFVAETGGAWRVAVTGAGPCAFRLETLETRLARDCTPAAVDGIRIDDENFNEDLFASRDYRAHLVAEMARRALADLAQP